MNAIAAPVSAKTPRSRSRAANLRPATTGVNEQRRGPRTRRLAAALAAVLALGGLAGSAQAESHEAQITTAAGSELSVWETIEQLWGDWLEDEEAAALADEEEGGSVDPETGDPKRSP